MSLLAWIAILFLQAKTRETGVCIGLYLIVCFFTDLIPFLQKDALNWHAIVLVFAVALVRFGVANTYFRIVDRFEEITCSWCLTVATGVFLVPFIPLAVLYLLFQFVV